MTITISAAMAKFVSICGGFTVVCVAAGWLYKIVKGIKSPEDKINKKLQNDKEEIEDLKEEIAELNKAICDIQEDIRVITMTLYHLLKHAQTSNNTGGMAKCEKVLFDHMNK